MAIYNSTKFLSLPQQVNKNKKDIEALQEVEINLNNYIPKTEKGEPLGVATLDANGKVPASQVPVNPGNFLPLSGGTMTGPIDMDGEVITDVAYIKVNDLHAKQISSGSGFQDVQFLSNIDLNSDHKIIGSIKGTGLTDVATIENINDHDDSPFSHVDIRNEILSLKGAWVLRGVVEFTTANVTQTRLNDRIQALMSRSPLLGDVLVDLDSHEWYFNGSIWNDFGQANIGLASSSSNGLMSSAQYNKLTQMPTGMQISNMVAVESARIDALVPIVADKEDEINKVTQFVDPNNITFPTTLAVFELVDGVHNELKEDIIDVNTNLTNYIDDEIQTLESETEKLANKAIDLSIVNDTKYPTTKAVKDQLDLTAKLSSSNVFTQPQQVPNATLPQHAVNKLQVETMFEMFKQQLRGYNLAKPDLIGKTEISAGVYRYRTQDGITMDYNINNGYVILNGTRTAGNNNLYLDLYRNVIPNGTRMSFKYYYVSGTFDSNTEYTFLFANSNNNPGGQPLKIDSDYRETIVWQNYEYNYNPGLSIARIFLGNGTITFNNFTFRVQLEKGSTATPYTVPGEIPQYKIVGEA